MIILTNVYIPVYVAFIASLGPKFSFYASVDENDLFKYLIVFEKLKDKINDFFNMLMFNKERKKFCSKFDEDNFRDRTNVQTKAQRFIKIQMERTKLFLENNPNVKVFPADKGGRIVIADLDVYMNKMRSYLNLNSMKGIYFFCKGLTVDYVRMICESKYDEIRNLVNEFFDKDKSMGFAYLCNKLAFEPFIISRIYGCFKVHKEDYPIRPIISSVDCMAKPLSDWLLHMLNYVAEALGEHQVRSANELFDKIEGRHLKDHNHVLVTWDFESMFTNIPFSKTKEIIRKYYHVVQKHTSMPVEIFLKALSFVVEDCAFFTFDGDVYLQTEGLSMGNSLSQILAEITTSYYLNEMTSMFRKDEISFIFKYVDDIVAAIDKDRVFAIQQAIESLTSGMKLKLTYENEEGEVDFLQLKIRRNHEDNILDIKWIQKEYSARHILDFHSFHPRRMKDSVINEYIKNALKLTSVKHWNSTIIELRKTLRNSNYSNAIVEGKINFTVDALKNKNKRSRIGARRNRCYVSCPYYPNAQNFVRRTVNKLGIDDVCLAPTIVLNNRNSIYSNLKDKRKLGEIKNSTFLFKCRDCTFEDRIFTNLHDVVRTMNLQMSNFNSNVSKHCRDNVHVMNTNVRRKDIIQFNNVNDLRIAKSFL